MGHTEGGSGITGLIKSVLALEHGIIPPNLNFTTPNPQSMISLGKDLLNSFIH